MAEGITDALGPGSLSGGPFYGGGRVSRTAAEAIRALEKSPSGDYWRAVSKWKAAERAEQNRVMGMLARRVAAEVMLPALRFLAAPSSAEHLFI